MAFVVLDGYVDEFGGVRNEKILGKLFNLLLKIHQKPMNEQKEILEKTVDSWRGNLEQIDDILVLGLQV